MLFPNWGCRTRDRGTSTLNTKIDTTPFRTSAGAAPDEYLGTDLEGLLCVEE
jgi:hypothetical protein